MIRKNFISICPRVSVIQLGKRFVILINGRLGGTHWTFFPVKANKSYYFLSFGVSADKYLLHHLPKPVIFDNFKVQNIEVDCAHGIAQNFSIKWRE